jgi:hypothetical protein
MKRTHTTTAALSFAALFLLASCVTQEPQSKDIEGPPSFSSTIKKAPTVPFCELIRDSAHYDKEIVRTQAIFFRNMENAYLYDPKCGGENAYIWAEFDPTYVYTEDAMKKKFDQLLCPAQPCPVGRAQVNVVGRFEGPSGGPYGHLDGYRFRFSLMRLEQAEAAEATISESK